MYNVRVTISTDKDLTVIGNQISAIVESVTNRPCRVSFVNNREQLEYKNQLVSQTVRKLQMENK